MAEKLKDYVDIEELFEEKQFNGKEIVEILNEYGCDGKSCYKNFTDMYLCGGTQNSLDSWMSKYKKGERTLSRDKVIMLAFALGSNELEVDIILSAYGFEGLHVRYFEDAIYFFFLINNEMSNCVSQYEKAYRMIEEYSDKYKSLKDLDEPLCDKKEGGDFGKKNESKADDKKEHSYTADCLETIKEFEDEEELRAYLDKDETKEHMGKITRTIKYHYYKNMNVIFDDLIMNKLVKLLAYRIEDIEIKEKNIKCLLEESGIEKKFEIYMWMLTVLLNPHLIFVKNNEKRELLKKESFAHFEKKIINAMLLFADEFKKSERSKYEKAINEYADECNGSYEEALEMFSKLYIKNAYNAVVLSEIGMMEPYYCIEFTKSKLTGIKNNDYFTQSLPETSKLLENAKKEMAENPVSESVLEKISYATSNNLVLRGKCTTLFELILLCKRFYFDELGESELFSEETMSEFFGDEKESYNNAYGGKYALKANSYSISRDMLIFVTFMKEYIDRLKKPKSESYQQSVNNVLKHCYMGKLTRARRMDRYIMEISSKLVNTRKTK